LNTLFLNSFLRPGSGSGSGFTKFAGSGFGSGFNESGSATLISPHPSYLLQTALLWDGSSSGLLEVTPKRGV